MIILNPELLERVKVLLDKELYIEYDDVLNEIITNISQMVTTFVGSEELPMELHFIVVEGTVSRFRKLGSEGISDESYDVISMTYESVLEPYIPYLEAYKKSNKKIKFL